VAFNVIEAENCWDAYMKTLKAMIDNNYDMRNVFLQVNNTQDNYVTFMPHNTDPLFWYLRVNSDVVEGELGIGCGLDVRYDQRRMSRVKGHGTTDWDYRLETGRPEHDRTQLDIMMERDEIFPNTSYQNMQRVGGRGQLHAVKDLLLQDKGNDKGIVTFWHYERDLLEYTRRRYIQKELMEMKRWSDSQHQRIPCPLTWHFNYSSKGITNNVYSRSLVWDGHIYDDLFRFAEPSKWIGGHMKKGSGLMTFTINRLWQKNFGRDKERWAARYAYWENHKWIKHYYEEREFPVFKTKEDFEREWLLKELAEQDFRYGDFEQGDKKIEMLQSQYYKEWVKAMKVADMTIAHRVLGTMLEKGIVSRPTKRALEYVDNYTIKQAILDIDGIFRVQCVEWVVNYILRSGTTDMDYREYLDILPEELQQLVLVASLNGVQRANKSEFESILGKLDKEILLISEYNDLVLPPKSAPVNMPKGEVKEEPKPEPQPEPCDVEEEDVVEEAPEEEVKEEKKQPEKKAEQSEEPDNFIASLMEQMAGNGDDDDDEEEDGDDDVNEILDNIVHKPKPEKEDKEAITVKPPQGKTYAELMAEIDEAKRVEEEFEEPEEKQPEPQKQEEPEQEEEEVRQPIKTERSSGIFVAAPYGSKRVNKHYGELLKQNLDAGQRYDECYFPIEPFHYREERHQATQPIFEFCVKHDIPISVETRRVVPDWAVEALAQHPQSEVRVHLNTMDNNKWKSVYPTKKAHTPDQIIESFIKCFNAGVYTILAISPIIPGIVSRQDVVSVVDKLKNWTPMIEVSFASFTPEEISELEDQLKDEELFEKVMTYYEKVDDMWVVKPDYKQAFLQTIEGFLVGSKAKLNVLDKAHYSGLQPTEE
jgi:predicted RNase H-like HicB family nuclease